ncbi:MAG: hypothetical protein A3B99_02105 [Candidatus Yanofskybacteria bacterium RIFCSPHIGHO2_02_FULL_44_12b]|uniref:Solute-binding protein family 5 domain-containing protein n=2 Tax=Candidatus Yanofskyibacteriota TaxID=1752733 RepID=A0A1F8GNB4_9BACT|nr:MAG: hypothetical protein UW79_C0012G0013 [Candidatus Yanofskybacteria bacterium GW2011_GWA2_44_9]OGN05194.1 MAG: hypothetical protein A2659_04180 [Candidatus Yanofskybacteria bacterium RIFCSPHIGHO2_01_FULL_44_24]OGN15253.1 MAG: hypothetical protein A3B99_02105 [Candidatus Yanofskybacteria bacterium RIFCSPHIGHO2_02_FULL_44_12b]OGN26915.1 MAG: hypothetical protein A2925_01440 [Candidatus Yanofskybacteria bacterium RIFCSPLOWO2_01_FULL_44_22]
MNKEKQLDDFFDLNSNHGKKYGEGIKETLIRRLSLKSKIRLLGKVLSKKERYAILLFVLIIAGSIIYVPFSFYYHFTLPSPDFGGSFVEGVIGEPSHVNPLLLSQTGSTDRDIVHLVYSSILKYNEEGKLVPDLAKSYEITSDGLNYTIYLKESARWHDGIPVTADDVIFTIQTAQNADYNSLQRINWQGVEIQKTNDTTLIFKLKNRYAQFLNNLTLHIMPRHLWENVQPANFPLSELNLKPIGSGPYKFARLQKDKLGRIQSYELTANKNFYDGRPYINKIQLKFYGSEEDLIGAYNGNEIENLSVISPKNLKKIKFKQRLTVQKISMPRYFGIFFNQNENRFLADKNIRLALSYATNKQELIDKVLEGNGTAVNSPMIGDILGINKDVRRYDYDPESAKKTLSDAGWKDTDENGILVKRTQSKQGGKTVTDEQKLVVRVTTSAWPELVETAKILKEQWKQAGIELEIESLQTADLQQAIKDRSYQMLLFGEILSVDPDPFSLWHSSQKRDPGLNLALYENKSADKLLEDARSTLNPLERNKQYDDFQKLVIEDLAAIFLYSPVHLYGQSKNIKGFENKLIPTHSERLSNIEKWHMDTKRVLK